eukprot:scaffold16377_cov58-Phaeocystis_antarctica.AAC.2
MVGRVYVLADLLVEPMRATTLQARELLALLGACVAGTRPWATPARTHAACPTLHPPQPPPGLLLRQRARRQQRRRSERHTAHELRRLTPLGGHRAAHGLHPERLHLPQELGQAVCPREQVRPLVLVRGHPRHCRERPLRAQEFHPALDQPLHRRRARRQPPRRALRRGVVSELGHVPRPHDRQERAERHRHRKELLQIDVHALALRLRPLTLQVQHPPLVQRPRAEAEAARCVAVRHAHARRTRQRERAPRRERHALAKARPGDAKEAVQPLSPLREYARREEQAVKHRLEHLQPARGQPGHVLCALRVAPALVRRDPHPPPHQVELHPEHLEHLARRLLLGRLAQVSHALHRRARRVEVQLSPAAVPPLQPHRLARPIVHEVVEAAATPIVDEEPEEAQRRRPLHHRPRAQPLEHCRLARRVLVVHRAHSPLHQPRQKPRSRRRTAPARRPRTHRPPRSSCARSLRAAAPPCGSRPHSRTTTPSPPPPMSAGSPPTRRAATPAACAPPATPSDRWSRSPSRRQAPPPAAAMRGQSSSDASSPSRAPPPPPSTPPPAPARRVLTSQSSASTPARDPSPASSAARHSTPAPPCAAATAPSPPRSWRRRTRRAPARQ